MKVIKLPLKKRYCTKCNKELPTDWEYEECMDCQKNNKKVTNIVKGIVAGGVILSVATGIFQTTKKIKKGKR